MARHPQVSIELSISNRNVDLVAEGYDMAIRLGELADSGLAAKRLAMRQVPGRLLTTCRAGTPQNLEQLGRHACLPFIMPSSSRQAPWLLHVDGQDMDWLAPARMLVSDDVLGVVSLAARTGHLPDLPFRRARAPEQRPTGGSAARPARAQPAFTLIYPPHRRTSAASRALIDSLPSQ
jgi:DNA-binding transcriptional LysR family regulator